MLLVINTMRNKAKIALRLSTRLNKLHRVPLALPQPQHQQTSLVNITQRAFSVGSTLRQEDVKVTFIRANGDRIETKGKVGDTLLDVVVNNSVDLDGFGACEGTLTCSTCHLIFKTKDFEKLPDKPGDEELDMLDLAYDLTDTSRLGCQITLSKELDGLEVHVPATINDARA